MLKGKYVGLRAIEESDLEQLLEWRNQPEYRKFFREYRELGLTNQKEWFNKVVQKNENTVMFSIVELSSGDLIGACGLCYIDWRNRCADFSIYIGKDNLYIDDVFAIDAARTMLRYGFEELNLYRVWSEIYDIDEKKKIMFDKLGFIHEATHVHTHWTEGKWVDSLYYRYINES